VDNEDGGKSQTIEGIIEKEINKEGWLGFMRQRRKIEGSLFI